VELLQCVDAALQGEDDAEARRAACFLLTKLLDAAGRDALAVLPASQVRPHRAATT
jgi:hypothetical protein